MQGCPMTAKLDQNIVEGHSGLLQAENKLRDMRNEKEIDQLTEKHRNC